MNQTIDTSKLEEPTAKHYKEHKNNNSHKNNTSPSKDLGEGNVHSLLWRLAFPTIIAQLVNLLYNLVDRIYIGHISHTGDIALTGLGLCFPIIMLITAFANMIGTGGAPRVAISMGKGDNKTAEKIVGNCFAALLFIAIILTVTLEMSGTPLLKLFGASANTLPFALSYYRIYVCGTVFVMITVGMNPFITTQGFTTDAMKTVLIGAICNIILDPILIFGFHMGVAGAALATIISQGISTIWVLYFLFGRRTRIRIYRENLRISSKIIGPVLALGISPFIMGSTESILNIAFNSSLSRYGGDIAVGAMTILSSVMQLLTLPIQGLTQGAQPIISYNYGARKTERVQKAYRYLLCYATGYTILFWLAVQITPETFVRIFNSSSPELITTTAWALRVYLAAGCMFGILFSVQQTFMALGQAKLSLFIASLRKIILLIPLIYILPIFMEDNVFAVFLAEPIADFGSIATAGVLFAMNIKRILRVNGNRMDQ